ncbi:hypothetical protein [Rhizobium sp. KDH_Rht_773_N]
MKTSLFTAALAAVLLPSCSDAGPVDGKSPVEIAAFIAFGYEDGGTGSTGVTSGPMKDVNFTATKISGEPFTFAFDLSNGIRFYTAAITTTDNCTFDVTFTPGSLLGQDIPKSLLRFDFSGLTGATVERDHGGLGVQFEGATPQCVKSDDPRYCKEFGKSPYGENDWRFRTGLVDEAHKAGADKYRQERLDQAIAYFRDNICKPKG